MNIIKSKNGTYYVSLKEGNEAIANARIKYHYSPYDYIVLNDRYYVLRYEKGHYYSVFANEPFISAELYSMFENEHKQTLQDLKENKEFYEQKEIDLIKGKLHYIAELLNKSRNQLKKLHLL